MTTLINNLLLSVVIAIGIIVLIALHDVSANVGIPILAALGGVHVGNNLAAPTAPAGKVNAPTSASGGQP